MTKIINSINIKIHEKKTKKRKYKKRNVRTQQNAPYTSVASLITNRPQQLDMSTASNREKDNIISNAINNVKREKEILTIKDKQPEILKIFESPKPPTIQPRKKITDFFAKTPEKNLYDTYPKEKTVHYDRVEELGAVNKKGRKMAPQKPTESTDDYINRLKKSRSFTMQPLVKTRNKDFTTPIKDVIPAPSTPITNKFIKKALQSISESKKSSAQSKKNMESEQKFNDKVTNVINSPASIHKLKNEHELESQRAARIRIREEKSNKAITDLFNSNQFL
jgi:hypothetical protein